MADQRILQSIVSRLRGVVGLGLVRASKYVDGVVLLQIERRDGETIDNVPHLQPRGFAYKTAGGHVVTIAIGADKGNTIAVTVSDNANAPELTDGQAAMWDDFSTIKMANNGNIEIDAPVEVKLTSPKVTVTAANMEVTGTLKAGVVLTATVQPLPGNPLAIAGDVAASGNVSDSGGSLASVRGAYNTHKHTGVTTGAGISGPTDTPA